MKNKLNLISSIAIVVALLLFSLESSAQSTKAPLFTLDGVVPLEQKLCVSQLRTDREAIAEANVIISAGIEIVLELSGPTGDFSDTTTEELVRFTNGSPIPPGNNIIFPSFEIPTDLRGDNYSLRVNIPSLTTNPLSDVQTNIPIYYFDFSEVKLTGPNPEANTAVVCEGGATTLTATPGDYPTYEWYFNGTRITGESRATLENVTDPGIYRVVFDAGQCNSEFEGRNERSIEVVDFNPSAIQINEPSPQEFCPNDTKILTVSVNDPSYTYEWFKDDVLVEELTGAIANLSQSNFGGVYTVRVTGSPTCSVTTAPVEVINLGSDILTQPPPRVMILPTQTTITLAITTNAPTSGSTAQWFRNGITFQAELPITDSRALSIEVSDLGMYSVVVKAADACSSELTATTEVFEPVGFNAVITTLLSCEDDTGNLGLENLFGITDIGEEVPLTLDQFSFFDFEWFLAGQSTGVTEQTFPVTADNVGEVYTLQATLQGASIPTATSNELTVEFLSDGVVIQPSMSFLPVGSTITLTAPLSATYAYEWFLVEDGENRPVIDGNCSQDDESCDGTSGQGTNILEISRTGQYFVRITLLDCVIDSQPITISNTAGVSEIIPNVVTPFRSNGQNDNWVLPDSLSGQQDVEVTIYDLNGQVDFKTVNYQDDWPLTTSRSRGNSPVYYYTITKNNSVVRKGSITVMK